MAGKAEPASSCGQAANSGTASTASMAVQEPLVAALPLGCSRGGVLSRRDAGAQRKAVNCSTTCKWLAEPAAPEAACWSCCALPLCAVAVTHRGALVSADCRSCASLMVATAGPSGECSQTCTCNSAAAPDELGATAGMSSGCCRRGNGQMMCSFPRSTPAAAARPGEESGDAQLSPSPSSLPALGPDCIGAQLPPPPPTSGTVAVTSVMTGLLSRGKSCDNQCTACARRPMAASIARCNAAASCTNTTGPKRAAIVTALLSVTSNLRSAAPGPTVTSSQPAQHLAPPGAAMCLALLACGESASSTTLDTNGSR